MGIEEQLSRRKEVILKRWFEQIVGTYPAETASFLKRHKDDIENPVAYRIYEGIEGIFDQLLSSHVADVQELSHFLDRIVRVRAIQDFTPSQALSFLLQLKSIIRRELRGEDPEEVLEFLFRIDELVLRAFDVYMACREKLYELKVDEWKRKAYLLLKRANMIYDPEPDNQNPGNTDSLCEAR
ncbi:RsbRD N-terminal domain-containing protein [Thermosulfuriphilus sp.]